MRRLVTLSMVFLLAACAGPVTRQTKVDRQALAREVDKQREIALQTQVDHFRRLYHVVFRTWHRAVSLCPRKRPDIGIYLINRAAFKKRYQKAAARLFHAGPEVQAFMVAKGSPAEQAGIHDGDTILRIDETPAPKGRKAVLQLRKLLRERMKKNGIVRLQLARRMPNGHKARLTTVVTPVQACDYRFGVIADDRVNAFANGRFVVLTTGMMRFVNNDDELALVVSHELAHNVMDHISKMRRNALLGTLLDLIAAGYGVNTQGLFGNLALLRYSKGFESEADYVGMYIMALGGWQIERAPNFWRRMAASHPGSNRAGFTRTHPISSRRFLALERIVTEIRSKQQAGQPLRPEMQPRPREIEEDEEDE